MTKEEVQLIAFDIIGHAGEALSIYYSALEKAKQGEFEQCEQLLKDGAKEMQLAHHCQTDLLCKESDGDNFEISLIMVHAQDHLMNVMLADKLIKELICLHKERQKAS